MAADISLTSHSHREPNTLCNFSVVNFVRKKKSVQKKEQNHWQRSMKTSFLSCLVILESSPTAYNLWMWSVLFCLSISSAFWKTHRVVRDFVVDGEIEKERQRVKNFAHFSSTKQHFHLASRVVRKNKEKLVLLATLFQTSSERNSLKTNLKIIFFYTFFFLSFLLEIGEISALTP